MRRHRQSCGVVGGDVCSRVRCVQCARAVGLPRIVAVIDVYVGGTSGAVCLNFLHLQRYWSLAAASKTHSRSGVRGSTRKQHTKFRTHTAQKPCQVRAWRGEPPPQIHRGSSHSNEILLPAMQRSKILPSCAKQKGEKTCFCSASDVRALVPETIVCVRSLASLPAR